MLQSCFISLSAFEPQHRSGGVIPFHLSSCMLNPLLSIPPPLSLLFLALFIFPSHLAPNLILPASSLHRSISLNSHPAFLPPPSIHPPLTLLLLPPPPLHKNTPQVAHSLYLLLPLPAHGMFAQRLSRALCR